MLHHFERSVNVRLVETSCDQCYTISNAMGVKSVEISRDRWHQHVNKISLFRMKMKFCFEKSTFSFGLSQKVNNNAPQAKRSVNFNTFYRTFITF